MEKENNKKQVSIQRRIEEVMNAEFERLLAETGDDPLLKLVSQNKLEKLSIQEIKKILEGSDNE
ncbi:MAG: hypothetical protein ACQCN3_13185 [Candidatus Bathyarchaeia archaeon]